MSRRNWRSKLALGGIALALTCSAAWDLAEAQKAAVENRQKPEAKQARDQTSSLGAAPYTPDCLAPKDHDEADICQQRDMAKSAEKTYDIAWKAVLIGVADSVLLLFTLIYTAIGASATRRQLEGLERPYLHVVPKRSWLRPDPDNASHRRVQINYEIRNHGRSPANIVSLSMGAVVALDDVDARIGGVWAKVAEADLSHFLPHDSEPFTGFRDMQLKITDRAKVEGAANLVFVIGQVQYDNVFGVRYERNFCFRCIADDNTKEAGGAYGNYDRRISRKREKIGYALGFIVGYFGLFEPKHLKKKSPNHKAPPPET